MSMVEIALIVVGVLWLGLRLLLAGQAAMHRTRDRILTGRTDEGVAMTQEHRRLLYHSDWAPLNVGIGVLAVCLSAVLLSLPALSADPAATRWFCLAAATLPIIAFLGTLHSRLEDRRHIRKALEEGEMVG